MLPIRSTLRPQRLCVSILFVRHFGHLAPTEFYLRHLSANE